MKNAIFLWRQQFHILQIEHNSTSDFQVDQSFPDSLGDIH